MATIFCQCEWHSCQRERDWPTVSFCSECLSDADGREPCRIDVLETALVDLMAVEGGEVAKRDQESAEAWQRARRAVYGIEPKG